MKRMLAFALHPGHLADGRRPGAGPGHPGEDQVAPAPLTIGTRTGSPPFAYVNKDNQWVGFSIDLVEQLVKPAVEKKVGKPIKVEKKESTPPTRIPLLTLQRRRPHRRHDDRYAAAPRERRLQPDVLLHGRPVHGEEGQPHQGRQRHRRQAHRGRSRARPTPRSSARSTRRRSCASSPTSRRRSRRWCRARSTPTPTTASSSPASRPRRRTRTSGTWSATSTPTSPTAWRCARATPSSRRSSTPGLKNGLEGGKYFEIYEKWFGPKGELPYPMTPQVKAYLMKQIGK